LAACCHGWFGPSVLPAFTDTEPRIVALAAFAAFVCVVAAVTRRPLLDLASLLTAVAAWSLPGTSRAGCCVAGLVSLRSNTSLCVPHIHPSREVPSLPWAERLGFTLHSTHPLSLRSLLSFRRDTPHPRSDRTPCCVRCVPRSVTSSLHLRFRHAHTPPSSNTRSRSHGSCHPQRLVISTIWLCHPTRSFDLRVRLSRLVGRAPFAAHAGACPHSRSLSQLEPLTLWCPPLHHLLLPSWGPAAFPRPAILH
jgi:hypothetical protein